MSIVKPLMKKPLVAAAAVILIAVAIFISSIPAANIKITEADMEQAYTLSGGLITREVTLSQGDTFTITLFAAGYAGMRWGAGSGDITVVRQDGAREFLSPFFGGRNGEKWTFKAASEGETIISMSYFSVAILDPPEPIRNTLRLKVTVN